MIIFFIPLVSFRNSSSDIINGGIRYISLPNGRSQIPSSTNCFWICAMLTGLFISTTPMAPKTLQRLDAKQGRPVLLSSDFLWLALFLSIVMKGEVL